MRFSLGFQLPICKPDGRLDRKKSFKQAGAAGVTGVQSGPLRLTYAFQSGISRLFASSRAAKTPLRRYVASADLSGLGVVHPKKREQGGIQRGRPWLPGGKKWRLAGASGGGKTTPRGMKNGAAGVTGKSNVRTLSGGVSNSHN